MTQEQIKLYNELKNELYESAERVAKHFVKINPSYRFIDSWELDENEVEGSGTDTWSYGGYEDHYGVPDETIERIISHFSDDKRQLIGVLWYNK